MYAYIDGAGTLNYIINVCIDIYTCIIHTYIDS